MIGQKKICIDFDGVIHDNRKFFKPWIANGEPVEGALEAIKHLNNRYDVVIHSTRCNCERGLVEVERWIHEHGFDEYCRVVDCKPVAELYLDDRGLTFFGDWQQTVKDVKGFVPWWRN